MLCWQTHINIYECSSEMTGFICSSLLAKKCNKLGRRKWEIEREVDDLEMAWENIENVRNCMKLFENVRSLYF